MGEEIDERAGGRFYGIAVGIDSVRLDGSQVPGGKNADLAIKWRYRDPTRRITLDLPRSKSGKPASSTICCRPCTARATRCYSRGDVAHEPDLRSRHSGWAPLSRTRQCERQPLGGPKSLVWVMGGKTLSEYMFSEYPLIADIVGAPIANLKISLRRSDPRCCSSSEIALVPGIVPIGSRSAYGDCIRPKLRWRGWRRGVLSRALWPSASSAHR